MKGRKVLRTGRTVLAVAVAALASAFFLGVPAGALAEDCIGCKGESAVDLDVSGRLIPSADGWSAAEFVITPGFPLLTHLPWYIPPTHMYFGFRGADHWGATWAPPLKCDFDFALGLLDCLLPTFSSLDGPKSVRIIGLPSRTASWGWGTFTATVDPHNDLAEYDEWNNVASVDVPLWPEREVYELETGDLNVTYFKSPPNQ